MFDFYQWIHEPINLDIVKSIGSLGTFFLGIAALINFLILNKNTKIAQDNLQLSELRLIRENFSQAIEQLSNEKIVIRLGGIYTLEKIAIDNHENYNSNVINILISFVREQSIHNNQTSLSTVQKFLYNQDTDLNAQKIPEDIQASLNILSRLNYSFSLNLSRINISNFNLKNCNFADAIFDRATLENINFKYALLQNTSFDKASLKKSDFYYADLENAKMCNANLEHTECRYTNFSKAILYDVVFNNSDLYRSCLTEAKFARANLKNSNINEVEATKTYFTQADLSKALCTQSNFKEAVFYKTILIETNLNDCILTRASFKYAKLTKALLIEIEAEKVNFQYIDAEGALFDLAKLKASDFYSANLKKASFRSADVQFIDFSYANLEEANFLEARNIETANFRRANLKNVIGLSSFINKKKFYSKTVLILTINQQLLFNDKARLLLIFTYLIFGDRYV